MRQKLKSLLKNANFIFRFLVIVAVMILPLVQFVYAYSFSEHNGELEESARMASYSSYVIYNNFSLLVWPCAVYAQGSSGASSSKTIPCGMRIGFALDVEDFIWAGMFGVGSCHHCSGS